MRKYAVIAMSMLLTLALMAPAAFAQLSAVGHITVRTALAEDSEGDFRLQGNARGRLNLRYNNTNRDNVSARFEIRLRHTHFRPFGDGPLSGKDGDRPELYEAYLTHKGAWIPGLPETTTTVGRFSANLNDWVGNFDRRDGIRVTGLDFGPASFSLYHGWENANRTLTGIAGSAKIDIVELKGAVSLFRDYATSNKDQERNTDYAVGATVKPANGISLNAEYASNGPRYRKAHDNTDWKPGGESSSAWKVGGELATIANLTLRASTWSTADDFRPIHRTFQTVEHIALNHVWTDSNSRPGRAWGDPWMKQGFSVGASTTQAGLPIDVSFKSGKIFEANLPNRIKTGDSPLGGTSSVSSADNDAIAGKNMNVIDVGTKIANIDLGLTYRNIEDFDTITDIKAKHVWRGSPLGGDVTLTGVVRLRSDKDADTEYAADAVWKAPNGLTLGLHYANYDRLLDWNHNNSADNLAEGVNIGKPGDKDGFAITAGYSYSF